MQLTRPSPRARGGERTEQGFTIVEVVIATALLSIIMAVVASSLWQIQRSETYSRGRTAALDDMRVSINRMTKDLRQTYSINGSPSATNLDVNTYVDGSPARVAYDMGGGALTRTRDGGTPVVLLTGLTDESIFTYTPDATTPNLVSIALAVKPSNLPETTLELTSEITFRNH